MARKRATPKMKAAAPEQIKVDIYLGPLAETATPDQLARLKAYMENHMLTWLKSDLKEETAPPIVCEEFGGPPHG
jgi:hypothetical protein